MPTDTNHGAETQVLLVDRYALVRDGLRALIDAEPDLMVVGTASAVNEGLCLAGSRQPDVVVLDAQLSDRSGIHLVRELRGVSPRSRALLLTGADPPQYLRAAMRAGVAGFLSKERSGSEVLAGIRTVARGGSVFDPAIAALVSGSRARPVDPITPREREVLGLVAGGMRNHEIALSLNISPRTVGQHVSNLMGKFGACSRLEAVMTAAQAGIISV